MFSCCSKINICIIINIFISCFFFFSSRRRHTRYLRDWSSDMCSSDLHPNLVLLRTFSKIYGLCGLRVGYALCGSRELPDALAQVRQPFFCNAAAQAAAVEALAHQDEVARRVERV